MTFTTSRETAADTPADSATALIWALMSHQVIRIAHGEFLLRGDELRNGERRFVEYKVTVEDIR